MKSRFLTPVVAGVILLAACGGGGEGDGEATGGTDVTVDMYDNRFQYTEIEVTVGGTVTWVGAGANPHNAVAADESWSTETDFGSLDQLEGDEATLTYNTPGTYVFFCTYHGNAEGGGMAGTLTVIEG